MAELNERATEDMFYLTYMLVNKLVDRVQSSMVKIRYDQSAIFPAFDCVKEIYRHVRPLCTDNEQREYDKQKETIQDEIEALQSVIRNRGEDPTFNLAFFLKNNKRFQKLFKEIDAFFDDMMTLKQRSGLGIPTFYKQNREEYLKRHMKS